MSLRKATNIALQIALAMGVVSCAASPEFTGTISNSTTSSGNPSNPSLMSARVQFDFSDFYSLASPNANGCAGDVMNLYDPLATRNLASLGTAPAPTELASAGGAYGGTYRPSFIKNVSVDITDSNSKTPGNLASGCSQGPAGASSCATFDYGATGGVSSTFAGSMLLLGGIQNSNYSGINGSVTNYGVALSCGPVNSNYSTSCGTSLYALGVDGLPASAATDPPSTLAPGLDSATTRITGFVNLATSSTEPADFIAGAGSFDPGVGSVALFGGTSVIGALSANGETAANDSTWIFNLSTQKWTQISPAPNVAAALEETYEEESGGSGHYLSNLVTGRANFGYTSVSGMAVNHMTTNAGGSYVLSTGAYAATADVPLDNTDRVAIVGGQDSGGFVSDSYEFNPTYGPEWMDTLGRYISGAYKAPAAGEAVQWMVSYPFAPLYNTDNPSSLTPSAELKALYQAHTPAPGVLTTNFGLAPLRDNAAGTYGSGYLFFLGGFDTTVSNNGGATPSNDSCSTLGGTCGMMLYQRSGRALGTAAQGAGESYPSNFGSVGNALSATLAGPTSQLTPSLWQSYIGTAGAAGVEASPKVPWYGGASVLPGLDLQTNDVVYFGGATCESYLLSSATNCNISPLSGGTGNPGAYYRLGQDPIDNNGAGTAVPSGAALITMEGSAPQRAGMAAARGTDPSGNPIVVAFGGMSAAGSGTDQKIYYLYKDSATGLPAWGTATPSGTAPNVPTNGALIFSHVTKKFYLFGGFSSASGTMQGDTWELSENGPSTCGSATSASCTFAWTQLDVTGGTTCSPSCPQARRSHRMVEVNYANQNPGGSVGLASGESTCSSSSPCSYGIFMEGGTPDGVTLLDDRWMFDPTANEGFGEWVQMHEMPARNLAAMASTDFLVAPSTTNTVHRAVLFGGEVGMANPAQASSTTGQYYVPPTLGDTWMYDYDNNSWNRVQLYGTGYNSLPAFTQTEETENRQAYDATGSTVTDEREVGDDGKNYVNELSPPPTSGGIMITRTLNGPAGSALAIPEVYMVGGRLKDGTFQPFDHVYKFCAGSTGESYYSGPAGAWSTGLPNDGTHHAWDSTCDAYNSTSNPFSSSPSSSYVGRWLRKTPSSTGSGYSSFMGTGTYDTTDDLLVTYGGLQSNSASPATTVVTDSAQYTTSNSIYEYSFPSSGAKQGSWAARGVCVGSPGAPTARYGASMIYNPTLAAPSVIAPDVAEGAGGLVIVGGYDVNGNPLKETVSGASGSYQIPDMWKAQRATDSGVTCYNWTQITTIGNSISGTEAPPQTGLSHMIAVYVPATGYSTGYYSTNDSSCTGVGPIETGDPTQSKLLAGGAYFDIDRTQLGPNENLLLNLTFLPLDSGNMGPTGTALTSSAQAYFRIHLVKTGETASELEETAQPRFLTYTTDLTTYPETVQTLSVIAPPTGQPQQQQILIPLTTDAGIDRIRIERYQGNAILIDAALYRMGYR